MPRILLVWAVLLAVLAFPRAARAQDDEPSLLGKKLSEWLTILKDDRDVNRRRGALKAVELIGPRKSKKVVPAVNAALRDDPDDRIREAAAVSLGRMVGPIAQKGEESETFPFGPVRAVLIAALRTDKAGRVRAAAARSLGQLEGEARDAVGVLAGALKDKHADTRTAAADALRRVGDRGAEEALPELQQALRDKNLEPLTRVHVARAMGRIGAKALPALPALKEVLGDAKAPPDVRKAAAESLGQFGKDAADAATLLGNTLTGKGADLELRRAAAAALDQFGADARPALADLKKALRDDDKYVRCLAMHTLGQMGSELGDERRDVVTALLRCLDDNILEVRLAALETFGMLGAEGLGEDARAVADRLGDTSRNDGQKAVREAAAVALKKIKGGA
jgi:HEAT repeat protein